MAFKDYMFWKKGPLVHDESKCTNCGHCAKRCPHLALKMDKNGKWKQRGVCMRCMRCINECPMGALSIGEPRKS